MPSSRCHQRRTALCHAMPCSPVPLCSCRTHFCEVMIRAASNRPLQRGCPFSVRSLLTTTATKRIKRSCSSSRRSGCSKSFVTQTSFGAPVCAHERRPSTPHLCARQVLRHANQRRATVHIPGVRVWRLGAERARAVRPAVRACDPEVIAQLCVRRVCSPIALAVAMDRPVGRLR